MTSPETAGVKMHPTPPVFPSNFDKLVKEAIDRERLDGGFFQRPDHLEWGASARLLDMIGTIIQVPVPSGISPLVMAEGLVAYVSDQFESWARKCFRQPIENVEQSGRDITPRGDSLRDGFRSEYKGDLPKIFIELLQGYQQHTMQEAGEVPYSRSIVVVQSSGMGKSRMIREASRLVFTIPLNVRGALSPNQTAYPPSDDNVRDYFLKLTPKTDAEVQLGCMVILVELFRHVRELVRRRKQSSGPELVAEWAEYVEDGETTKGVGQNRLALYKEVISRSYQRLTGLPAPLPLNGLTQELALECRGLKNAVGLSNGDSFYVTLDEAQALNVPRAYEGLGSEDEGRKRSIYSNLNIVLARDDVDLPFFIFSSTDSQLYQSPPLTGACSSPWHAAQIGHALLPPWTMLPLNIFAKETVEAHERPTLDKASTIEFMDGFGRPLWHVHYTQEVAHNRHECHNHVFRTASKKLASGALDSSENRLAAIGVRIGFNFHSRTTSARGLESRMVKQHMRVAMEIHSDGEYMDTAAPSEPVLAGAAGGVCKLSEDGVSILDYYFRQGVLPRGECGEIIGRLLLTLAHDEALRRHGYGPASRSLQEPMYHRPVALLDFLMALFHEDHHGMVLGARSTEYPRGVPLRDAFKEAYIHLSHLRLLKTVMPWGLKICSNVLPLARHFEHQWGVGVSTQ